MFYRLPITKEQILSLSSRHLERNDDTWVDGVIYYQQKDDLLKYHIDDERKTITICIPTENFYLVYSMDTSKLAFIVRTSTCWSDDWTRYDFNEKGALYFIEDRAYGNNRRAYITVENGIVTNVESIGKTFGTYCVNDTIILDDIFSELTYLSNEYY